MRIYLDSNAVIRMVEGRDDSAERLAALASRIARGRLRTSELTLSEVLVGALRAGASDGEAARRELADGYAALIAPGATVEPFPVNRALLIAAARLRASDLALKLPDAIHVASAIADGCGVVVSHDRRVRSVAQSLGSRAASLDLADLDALLAEIDAAP